MALTTSPDVPSRVPEIIGVCSAFAVLIALTILLRLYARLKVLGVNLQLDDWTALVAALLSLWFCIDVPLQTTFGLGHHIYDLTDPVYFSGSLKLFFVGEIVYYVAVFLTKISLLVLYLRIFVPKGLRYITWATIAFVTITMLVTVFAVIFQCSPVSFAWDKSIPNGRCLNQTIIFYTHAGVNLVTDFIIYILPMRMLWGVVRPVREKIGLVVVFAVGGFVCLAGIVRLFSLQKALISTDPSWDNEPSAIWSVIECCVGVICASVPSLKPLFNGPSNRMQTGSFRLSEGNQMNGRGTGRGTPQSLDRSGKWDVEISGGRDNEGLKRNGISTESVKSLVGNEARPKDFDRKTAIYTSKTVTISHEDGLRYHGNMV